MKKTIRIGTRDSELALWQANYISSLINNLGHSTEIIHIKSKGELNLTSPLYEMGVQGIFTKALDQALINGEIDMVVHSLKDVPTAIAKGLHLSATPKRGAYSDTIVYKSSEEPDLNNHLTIGTSSLRRKAQWLEKYPHHKVVPIRGNINSRLRKLLAGDMDAVIFATAGLNRINLEVPLRKELDWMISAPAQGALGVFCREEDQDMIDICRQFHDEETYIATNEERQFLRTLGGGCSLPIAAHVTSTDHGYKIVGNIVHMSGQEHISVEREIENTDNLSLGSSAARDLLNQGGQELITKIQKEVGYE